MSSVQLGGETVRCTGAPERCASPPGAPRSRARLSLVPAPPPVRAAVRVPAPVPVGTPRSPRSGRPVAPPPLRLTRRGRRVVAGLAAAIAVGTALLVAALLDGGSGGLRLAGDSSVVVQSGDTLWSIAVTVAPERDTRAVVDAIVAANHLPGVDLVPGQVLQLP